MTKPRAELLEVRPRPPAPTTMAGDLVVSLRDMLDTRITWPSPVYRDDPEGFAHYIIGTQLWEREREIIRAVRDHDRVAGKAGRKVSKTHMIGVIANWFYCSFDDAQVFITAPTDRQVNEIAWREISLQVARSGRCWDCKVRDPKGPTPCPHSARIDGQLGQRAETGLRSDDFRKIIGFSARDPNAVQGFSGSRVLYICDEASGVPDFVIEALEGNRAGKAKMLLFGNPTKNMGELYDAFHSKKRDLSDPDDVGYVTFTISSEESPNVVEGREVIPGLATREWIREREEEWGRDSALFKIHVLGQFAENETGSIFSVDLITQAQTRWHETTEAGRLYLGVDPSGESGSGDPAAFCTRRGNKVIDLLEKLGLTPEGHIVEIVGILKKHRLPREKPVVVIDREGEVGWELLKAARAYLRDHPEAFELVGVRSSDKAKRRPGVFGLLKDELVANLEAWFRDGGAIPDHVKLYEELHALAWDRMPNGKLKVTPKKQLRKKLGRSTNLFDALALSAWEPLSLRDTHSEEDEDEPVAGLGERRQRRTDDDEGDEGGGRAFDPYRGSLR